MDVRITMYITNGNIVIRNATACDAHLLCTWWNDGKIMAHAGYPYGIGCTEQEILKNLLTDTDYNRRLIVEVNGIPAGEMNYRTIAEGTAELGIKICNSSQQNKGLGTLSLTLLINDLFTNLKYDAIVLDTNAKNTRAQHVYEKLGFRKVALHLNSWKNQLGEWQSSIDYKITKAEFHP